MPSVQPPPAPEQARFTFAESDAAPSITRISDGAETGFSLATSKERKGFDKFAAGTVLATASSSRRCFGMKLLTPIARARPSAWISSSARHDSSRSRGTGQCTR